MRRSTILWFLIATCVGVALFLLKYEVQNKEERLAELHREILADQEAIHVLEAEWSYLNRPDHLEALVRRHLDLVPLDERRVGTLDVLPMRMPLLNEMGDLPSEEELISVGLPPIPALRPFLGSGVGTGVSGGVTGGVVTAARVQASEGSRPAPKFGPRAGSVRNEAASLGGGPLVLTSGGGRQ